MMVVSVKLHFFYSVHDFTYADKIRFIFKLVFTSQCSRHIQRLMLQEMSLEKVPTHFITWSTFAFYWVTIIVYYCLEFQSSLSFSITSEFGRGNSFLSQSYACILLDFLQWGWLLYYTQWTRKDLGYGLGGYWGCQMGILYSRVSQPQILTPAAACQKKLLDTPYHPPTCFAGRNVRPFSWVLMFYHQACLFPDAP